MKKIFALMIAIALMFTLAACGSETGDYEPGTYFGYTDGHNNTYAVVVINEDGFIEDIFVDTVYLKAEADGPVSWVHFGNPREGIATTKMALDQGCDYNMWPSVNHWGAAMYEDWDGAEDDRYDDVLALFEAKGDCEAPPGHLMWHEQVRAIIEEILEAQEIPDFEMDGKYLDDDVIAGVTITVDTYLGAIEAALNQAISE